MIKRKINKLSPVIGLGLAACALALASPGTPGPEPPPGPGPEPPPPTPPSSVNLHAGTNILFYPNISSVLASTLEYGYIPGHFPGISGTIGWNRIDLWDSVNGVWILNALANAAWHEMKPGDKFNVQLPFPLYLDNGGISYDDTTTCGYYNWALLLSLQ